MVLNFRGALHGAVHEEKNGRLPDLATVTDIAFWQVTATHGGVGDPKKAEASKANPIYACRNRLTSSARLGPKSAAPSDAAASRQISATQ